jgi:hypothetical protein
MLLARRCCLLLLAAALALPGPASRAVADSVDIPGDFSQSSIDTVGVGANLTDLFTELDARLPTGYYRGPSLVTTPNGTLLAFVLGALHRHDGSPTIVCPLRRTLALLLATAWSVL